MTAATGTGYMKYLDAETEHFDDLCNATSKLPGGVDLLGLELRTRHESRNFAACRLRELHQLDCLLALGLHAPNLDQ